MRGTCLERLYHFPASKVCGTPTCASVSSPCDPLQPVSGQVESRRASSLLTSPGMLAGAWLCSEPASGLVVAITQMLQVIFAPEVVLEGSCLANIIYPRRNLQRVNRTSLLHAAQGFTIPVFLRGPGPVPVVAQGEGRPTDSASFARDLGVLFFDIPKCIFRSSSLP